MAVTIETIPALIRRQSIARVELFTDAARKVDDWELVIHFEDGLYNDKGELSQPTTFGSRVVRRRFGDIKDDQEVIALVEAIKAKAYAYREADIAAVGNEPE